MAINPSTTPATNKEPQYPVFNYFSDPIQPSTLRAIAHTLGQADTQCSKFSEPFNEVLFTRLCPAPGHYNNFTYMIHSGASETSRFRLHELLVREHQKGVRIRLNAAPTESLKDDRNAYIAGLASDYARNRANKQVQDFIKSSDLYRVVLPVLDTLLPMTGNYLVARIPPHVGHGVRRTLAFEGEAAIQLEKEQEAQQDRGAASYLLQKLKNFLTQGTIESFHIFMRNFSSSGDWVTWIAQPPPAGAPYPHAEQVIANTVALLYKFKEFTSEYEREFMTPGRPASFCRWRWFEPCVSAGQADPLAHPLYAGALDILTRQDFKHEQA